jgi:1A family penicillin-binding protein
VIRPQAWFLALALPLAGQGPADYIRFPLLPAGARSVPVTDAQGRAVGRILPQQRYWVTLDHIPAYLQQAQVAVEDSRFYEHGGIDVRGIARALVKDVAKGRVAEGGSTITQQLMKIRFLSAEKSLDRKVREARLAMDFESRYSKQQILEMYLNEIYFGNGAWGIAQAARLYFDKRPEELTYGECMLLVGVPKNPARYNPFAAQEDVARRRDTVLNRLVDLRIISADQRQELWRTPAPPQPPSRAQAYLGQVRTELVQRFGAAAVEQGALEVTAAIDLKLQDQAEAALGAGLRRLGAGLQSALVCMDPATGAVLAAVGGVGPGENALNRAFVARRQPGSAIKPLIYAAALESGVTAASIWNDAPETYTWGNDRSWRPQNYGKEQLGDISLRQALAHSNNVVTVKLLQTIGVPALVELAGKAGLTLDPSNGLSLALGTFEVTLKDLVQAYTPLAAGGVYAQARTILRVRDRRNQAWVECGPVLSPVLSPAAAYITTDLLKGVLTYGTAKSLDSFAQAHPAAGKTGTTDSAQDAWFVGYTPHLVTGVWVGCDQPRPGGRGFTGGAVAAPIWERFMARAVNGDATDDFPRPDTVATVAVDPATGAPPALPDTATVDELFVVPATMENPEMPDSD